VHREVTWEGRTERRVPDRRKVHSYLRRLQGGGKERTMAPTNPTEWWEGVRWMTGDVMRILLNQWGHEDVLIWSKASLTQTLRAWKTERVHIRGGESKVVVNTGSHWFMLRVNALTHSALVVDPYEAPVAGTMEVADILIKEGWKVQMVGMGAQDPLDHNTCGYQVLSWVWQETGRNSMNMTEEEREIWVRSLISSVQGMERKRKRAEKELDKKREKEAKKGESKAGQQTNQQGAQKAPTWGREDQKLPKRTVGKEKEKWAKKKKGTEVNKVRFVSNNTRGGMG
jgi:hypothetical protein